MKYVVPPLALEKMEDADSYTISSVAELIFSFTYDKRGRLIEKQVHGPIIQTNDYYPFGLQTTASMSQDFITPNKRLYNAGSELNEQTQNFETFYRHYDPALGRFNGVDIKATWAVNYSPYHYALDNPVSYNDPFGDSAQPYIDHLRPGYGESGPYREPGGSGRGSGYWANDYTYTKINSDRTTTFYNPYCGCDVYARGFLDFGDKNGNQNGYLRELAQDALNSAHGGGSTWTKWNRTKYRARNKMMRAYNKVSLRAIQELTSQTYMKIDGKADGIIDGVFNTILLAKDRVIYYGNEILDIFDALNWQFWKDAKNQSNAKDRQSPDNNNPGENAFEGADSFNDLVDHLSETDSLYIIATDDMTKEGVDVGDTLLVLPDTYR